MLVYTALYALTSAAMAGPDPHQAFRDWLWSAVKAEDLGVLYWGALDLDRDGDADEAMAVLCGAPATDASGAGPTRVYAADGHRWVVEGERYACRDEAGDPPPFGRLGAYSIGFQQPGPTSDHAVFLEVVGGRLELTRVESSGTSGMMNAFRTREDWVRRVTYHSWTNYWTERRTLASGEVVEEIGQQTNHAALIVVEPKATGRPTLNRVLSGVDTYDGPDDATLSVTATEPSPGRVDVILRVTDDVRTSKDHLELWWCGATGRCNGYDTIRQLIVSWATEPIPTTGPSWLYDQPPVATWGISGAPGGPTPSVSQDIDGAITVHFTHQELGIDEAESWSRPFTAVFVDVDVPAEPPTRIATSDLEWSDRVRYRYYTLGTLARYRDLHPFPNLRDWMRLDPRITAIRALEPGETLLQRARTP